MCSREIQGLPVSYKRQVMYDYNIEKTRSGGRRHGGSGSRLLRGGITLGLGALIAYGLLDYLPWFGEADQETAKIASIGLTLPSASADAPNTLTTIRNAGVPFEPRTAADFVVTDDGTRTESTTGTEVVVAAGDNLSLIFARHGFSKKDLHAIINSGGAATKLRRLKPGQIIIVDADSSGHVLGMVQELDYLRSLHVVFEDDAYSSSIVQIEPEIRYASMLAQIKQSLFLDGQAAGLADKTIMEVTNIFGWDIDFVLDVRRDDQFSVVFEEIFKNGEKIKNGKILAAEFVNQGEKLRAVYYSHEDGHAGYYSDKGRAMQKAFLRAPVNFTRISSRFNLQRRHPILNTIRAHKGVDYAAPHGTPIRATANGKIIHAGSKGGYGRTVIIQHGESYSTLFAHMSRYARGIKSGTKVKQGQTIGYVGKTGLATGPHLHYEFRINGVHRNPLKIPLPKALAIDAKYIADFRSKATPLLARLDELSDKSKSERLVAGVDLNITQTSRTETH